MNLSKEQANALLAEKLKQISEELAECEALADEHGLSFSSPIDHYGMGGYYYGAGTALYDGRGGTRTEGIWYSSSESC